MCFARAVACDEFLLWRGVGALGSELYFSPSVFMLVTNGGPDDDRVS